MPPLAYWVGCRKLYDITTWESDASSYGGFRVNNTSRNVKDTPCRGREMGEAGQAEGGIVFKNTPGLPFLLF